MHARPSYGSTVCEALRIEAEGREWALREVAVGDRDPMHWLYALAAVLAVIVVGFVVMMALGLV